MITLEEKSKSENLQEFKNEQLQIPDLILIREIIEPLMSNSNQVLERLIDERAIESSTFKPMDTMKVRFLSQHCWDKIKEKERSYKGEGVVVSKADDANSLEVKGTKKGRSDMIMVLGELAGKVDTMVCWFFFL